MKKRWSQKPNPSTRYELKKEYEEKYIGYLQKRYGKNRARSFTHQNS